MILLLWTKPCAAPLLRVNAICCAFCVLIPHIKVVVVHPSFEPILPHERWKQAEASKNSLRILAEEAASFGAQIAVECLPRTCLGNSIDSMAKLLSCDGRLRVCFDTNHMLTDTNEAFVRAFGEKIITIHVSDYDRIDERAPYARRGRKQLERNF